MSTLEVKAPKTIKKLPINAPSVVQIASSKGSLGSSKMALHLPPKSFKGSQAGSEQSKHGVGMYTGQNYLVDQSKITTCSVTKSRKLEIQQEGLSADIDKQIGEILDITTASSGDRVAVIGSLGVELFNVDLIDKNLESLGSCTQEEGSSLYRPLEDIAAQSFSPEGELLFIASPGGIFYLQPNPTDPKNLLFTRLNGVCEGISPLPKGFCIVEPDDLEGFKFTAIQSNEIGWLSIMTENREIYEATTRIEFDSESGIYRNSLEFQSSAHFLDTAKKGARLAVKSSPLGEISFSKNGTFEDSTIVAAIPRN